MAISNLVEELRRATAQVPFRTPLHTRRQRLYQQSLEWGEDYLANLPELLRRAAMRGVSSLQVKVLDGTDIKNYLSIGIICGYKGCDGDPVQELVGGARMIAHWALEKGLRVTFPKEYREEFYRGERLLPSLTLSWEEGQAEASATANAAAA